MANSIKYSTGSETLTLKKGNFYIGVGDVGKGPTSTTGYYAGVTPPTGGYTIYLNKESNGPSIYTCANDTELINLTNSISQQSFTGINQCFVYYSQQSDKLCVNKDYEGIITDGLIYNIDAGFPASYPQSGNTVYGLTTNESNGNFINGLSVDSTYGIPAFNFEGTNGFINMSPPPFVENTSVGTVEVLFYAPPNAGYWNPYHRGTLFYQGYRKGQYAYGTSFGLRIQENNQMLFFGIFSDATAYNMWTPGEWTHVVCKVQGGTAYFYKNGVYSQGRGMNGVKGINIKTTGAYIGKQRDADYLVGSIALVRAYDRFLSDEEVAHNYSVIQSQYGL